jgi:hypothetical protein
MKLSKLSLGFGILVLTAIPASADVSLNDWCININGVNVSTNACNGGGALPASVTGTFDYSLTSTTTDNKLGTIKVSVGTGTQFVGVFMDYDIDLLISGSFADVGVAVGSVPTGVTYELDDPNVNNPYFDFAANTLTNNNAVDSAASPTCHGPLNNCDVSWALIHSVFVDPLLYSGGEFTFTVGRTAPSGFYLQQTNPDTSNSVFLSESFVGTRLPVVGGEVPEPQSWLLLGTVVAGLGIRTYRRKVVGLS